jgi:hypothetical protein
MKTFASFLLTVLAAALPLQAGALCDIAAARVIHAETTPFADAGANTVIYWVAAGTTTPRYYYAYSTDNQTFIGLLNTALASGKQVRVTGDAGSCPTSGVLRTGGTVVSVFIDWFN